MCKVYSLWLLESDGPIFAVPETKFGVTIGVSTVLPFKPIDILLSFYKLDLGSLYLVMLFGKVDFRY